MNSKPFPKIDKTWTLFLDRDGVINRRIVDDYVRNVQQFEIFEGVVDTISKLSHQFARTVIVTNQQGIGKGLMSEQDLANVHQDLADKVTKAEGKIDQFYFAPQLKAENSIFRKPNIGMALKACSEFPEIVLEKSIMVGDSMSDMEFGRNAGMVCVFVSKEESAESGFIDYRIDMLVDIVELIE